MRPYFPSIFYCREIWLYCLLFAEISLYCGLLGGLYWCRFLKGLWGVSCWDVPAPCLCMDVFLGTIICFFGNSMKFERLCDFHLKMLETIGSEMNVQSGGVAIGGPGV